MNMETKFKVGDRVIILDCPVMPDAVGKLGIIRYKQGDLYRVEVDGKVIPDYALETDIELESLREGLRDYQRVYQGDWEYR